MKGKGEKEFVSQLEKLSLQRRFSFLIKTLLGLNSMQQCGKEITGEMVYKAILMLSNNHNRQVVTKGAIVQVFVSLKD